MTSVADQGQAPGLAYGNSHGDLIATYAGSGAVVTSTDFGPFGEQLGGALASSVGYQGEWTDPDTGDVNMHARWYQPGTGRFASRDTVTLDPFPSVQANRFTYGNANPVRYIDPSGHSTADTISCGRLCVPLDYIARGIQQAENYANRNRNKASSAASRAGSAARLLRISPVGVFLSAWLYPGTLANGTCNGPCNYGNQQGPILGPRNNGPQYASASGGSIVRGGGGGGTGWMLVPVGGGSGGPNVTYIYVPIVVDNRKEILREILNTPQERPPMSPVVSRDQVDRERLEIEAQAQTHRVATIDDLYEEFEFGVTPLGIDPASRRENLPSGVDEQNDECVPYTNYGYIDTGGRRSGIVKRFCSSADLAGGSDAGRMMIPGFPSTPRHHPKIPNGLHAYNRGHLLGVQLGGSGKDERNLVNMNRRTNDPVMKFYETEVREAVESGQQVVYSISPICGNDPKTPDLIHMRAVGDDGYHLDVCITKEYEPSEYKNVPCVGGGRR